MARDGFTPREAATQSIGTLEAMTRVLRLWHDRTLKTPEEVQLHLNAASYALSVMETLQSDLYALYSDEQIADYR